MLRSVFPWLCVVMCAVGARAEAPRETIAIDRASEALAEGRPSDAVRILRGVKDLQDPAAQARVQCLLGSALLQAGDPKGAEGVLAAVPQTSVCGSRAALLQAEALERLGRLDEASAIYERVASPMLGDDRDGASARAVGALADRLIADRERGRASGVSLLRRALDFQISEPHKREIAREIATLLRQDGRSSDPAACESLVEGLSAEESSEDRHLAMIVCDQMDTLTIATGLPDDDTEKIWRIADLYAWDPFRFDALRLSALAIEESKDPQGERLRDLRWQTAQTLADHLRLDALPLLERDGRPDALLRAADLLASAGRHEEALERLERHIRSFPTDLARAEVSRRRAELWLALARSAEDPVDALSYYDRILEMEPGAAVAPVAAVEAGYVERARGQGPAARERWEEARARWPESSYDAMYALARQLLVDGRSFEAASDLLRDAPEGGIGELTRMEEEDIWVESAGRVAPGKGKPSVRVGARNLQRVELRLHEIDLEAWVRSGASLSDLESLDVQAIAPDQTLTVPVPESLPGVDRVFDVPLPVGKGLWSVTAAAPEEEAVSLLLVSDLVVVARAVGDDLAVATFDTQGKPAPHARVLVAGGGQVIEGETDGTGLYVLREGSPDNPTVVAERSGSWAATSFEHGVWGAPSVSSTLSIELDRPVYLPGDRAGLRLIAHDESGKPIVGQWTLWLSEDRETTPVQATSDARGILTAELLVPSHLDRNSNRKTYTVMAVPPDSASPLAAGTLTVAAPEPFARSLSGFMDGRDAIFEVRGPGGEPLEGIAIAWGEKIDKTDIHGQIRVRGPEMSIPWSISASLVGSSLSESLYRGGPRASHTRIRIDEVVGLSERAAASISLRDDLERPLSGRLSLAIYRRIETPEVPGPAPDPFVEIPDESLRGILSWQDLEPPPGPFVLETVTQQEIELQEGKAEHTLPELPAGQYVIAVTDPAGLASSSSTSLTIADSALDLQGVRDLTSGEDLLLSLDGGSALVTAESSALLWAAVWADGRRERVPTDFRWEGEVAVTATSPDGRFDSRTLQADPDLHVSIRVESSEEGETVTATVLDGSGKPVEGASVSLRAFDERLSEAAGEPRSLSGWLDRGTPNRNGGLGFDLADGGVGEEVAPGLLAEATLARERARVAEIGALGVLSDNALAAAMLGNVPLYGRGSFGGAGRGEGGIGMGSLGSKGFGRGAGRVVSFKEPGVPGVRQRGLWQVLETDRSGAVRATFRAAPARYAIHAAAVTEHAIGSARASFDARERVYLAVQPASPGLAGDLAKPRVTLVNGTDAEVSGVLSLDGEPLDEIRLEPRSSRSLSVGAGLQPGPAEHTIAWEVDKERREARWSFPLAAGVPSADGPLTVVASGPEPLRALAQRPDPDAAASPWRRAPAGRALLATLPPEDRKGVRDPELLALIRDAREIVRVPSPPSALAAATVALFLAEIRTAGISAVSDAEIEGLLESSPEPHSAVERLWLARARAAASLPDDPDLLMLFEQPSEDESALLALIELSRPGKAGKQKRIEPPPGAGILSASARARIGLAVDPALLPGAPPPGDPLLADWIVAMASGLSREASAAAPTAVGGVQIPPSSVVVASGEPTITGPALTFRANPPEIGRDIDIARVLRLGASEDGGHIPSADGSSERCDPCVLGLGEAIALRDPPRGLPSGLLLDTNGPEPLLRATSEGRFAVAGLGARSELASLLNVEVVERRGPEQPLKVGAAIALAEHTLQRGEIPEIPPRQTVPDSLVPRYAALALGAALLGTDEALVARSFLSLASADRSARLPLSTVTRAAIALRKSGDPAASIRVWRAGLDAAFAAEASSLARIEGEAGPLAVIQKVREAALRYPDGPLVGEALYLLPARLLQIAGDGLPEEVASAGISRIDLELTAVAWDREFLALYRDHALAPVTGLRMARTLLSLRLPDLADAWAERVAAAHTEDPMFDALLYVRALALTERGDEAGARDLLQRIAERPFLDASGTPAPSVHRPEALLVLGRWEEARGNKERAKERYVSSGLPEGHQAAEVLSFSGLKVPSLVRLERGKSALPVEAVEVGEVSVRIYRVDLRTLFLRDGGLHTATAIDVAGVSPEWSGERQIGAGPYWGKHEISLPLQGEGAWLVQLSGDRVGGVSLVVRSDLTLSVLPEGEQDRISVRRDRRPVLGAEIRALDGGANVIAALTDARGVALVPRGASVLAWSGEQWAFTEPTEMGSGTSNTAREISPLSGLVDPIDRRLQESAAHDNERWNNVTNASSQLELRSL